MKGKKENAIQHRLEQLFEDNLNHLAQSIHRKGCTKNYQKVCERIGRLKEKYSKAVIGYHILHTIRTRLKQAGLNYRWETIRKLLSTHGRITTRLNTESGKTIYIRKCSEPEPFPKTIYDVLNLDYLPCKPKKVTIE